MTYRCLVSFVRIKPSNERMVLIMKYEIVRLEEKIAVGVSARTNNMSPDMGAVIGGLWNRFYNEGIYASIPGKAGKKALGIYTDRKSVV